MKTTNGNNSLHSLTPQQEIAVAALATGSTHEKAAELAGVHRVTVTKWATHHPAFIARLNQLRSDAEREIRAKVVRMTTVALETVAKAVEDGDLDAAFKWLRLAPPSSIIQPVGPVDSKDVVDNVRKSMPGEYDALFCLNTSKQAEELIKCRLL